MEDLDGLIQQIYRDQDLTQGEAVPSHSHRSALSLVMTPQFSQELFVRTALSSHGTYRVK